MRNRTIFILFSLLFCSCKQNKGIIKTIIENKDVITVYDSNKYMNKTQITFNEMKEDLDCFEYLLRTSYSGYDAACSRGMNTAALSNDIIKHFYGEEYIPINKFVEILYDYYKPFIKDYHASLFYKKDEYKFINPVHVLFSDIYVKKGESENIIVKSGIEGIEIGAKYKDKDDYLFYYPSKGEKVYRLGIVSAENTNKLKLKINDDIEKEISVNFYNSLDEEFNVETKESKKSLYIKYNSCCCGNERELEMQQLFTRYAKQSRNKEFVIIDVRGNSGGTDEYIYKFFFSLFYGHNVFNFIPPEYKQIYSPAILESVFTNWKEYSYQEKFPNKFRIMRKKFQKKPMQIIETCGTRKSNNYSKKNIGRFKGKVIIISDSYSASAGEEIICIGKNFIGDNLIQIGQNTAGCQLYGNIQYYYLCNSGIGVSLASSDFSYQANKIKSFHGEGHGYYPDYWSTNEDLNETIFYITQDIELRNELNDFF